MAQDQKPVFNEAGTHVYTVSENGQEWLCPEGVLPVFLARGFKLCEPRDDSLDGLYDPHVLAEKQKSSKTGD